MGTPETKDLKVFNPSLPFVSPKVLLRMIELLDSQENYKQANEAYLSGEVTDSYFCRMFHPTITIAELEANLIPAIEKAFSAAREEKDARRQSLTAVSPTLLFLKNLDKLSTNDYWLILDRMLALSSSNGIPFSKLLAVKISRLGNSFYQKYGSYESPYKGFHPMYYSIFASYGIDETKDAATFNRWFLYMKEFDYLMSISTSETLGKIA